LRTDAGQSHRWGSGSTDVQAVDAQSDIVVTADHRRWSSPPPSLHPLEFLRHRIEGDSQPTERVSAEPVSAKPHYVAFVVKALIIAAVALALFFLYQCSYKRIEGWTGIGITHVSCVVFMLLSVSTDLSTKSAAKRKGGHYAFDPAIAVVIVEACKLLISTLLFGISLLGRPKDDRPIVLPDIKDVLVLAVPGLVYTCNNILVFEAIEKVPLATFAVIRETRLVWNALIWMMIFKVPIGVLRWMAIAGVIVGCSANQVPSAIRSGFTWGVMYAFLLAFLNASGGVCCEYAMKMKASMDINLQNAIIYASCSGLALMYLAVFRSGAFESPATFFHGFEPECLQIIVLQVITGLTVSRILKHVESITKSMVAALCSPLICFLGSAALHVPLRWNEILASFVVLMSCLFFFRLGPLQIAAPGKETDVIKAPTKETRQKSMC